MPSLFEVEANVGDLGAYLMAVIGGKESPTAEDIKTILEAGGIGFEEDGLRRHAPISPPPSSPMSPKRPAGAGVGVGMLRGRGIPLVENKKVSDFQSLQVPKLQSFQVPQFHVAEVSNCQSFKVSKFQNAI